MILDKPFRTDNLHVQGDDANFTPDSVDIYFYWHEFDIWNILYNKDCREKRESD